MQKFVKQVFSRQVILIAWLPTFVVALIFFILDRPIPEFSVANLIVGFEKICIRTLFLKIPIWFLLILILLSFLIYKIIRGALNEEQKFILSIIDEREVGLMNLALAYKRCYPKESRIKTKCFKILNKLERLKLIKLECYTGGAHTVQEEIFGATDKGKKRQKKIEREIREKAEEIFEKIYYETHGLEYVDAEIEENKKDIGFILRILANKIDKKELKSALLKDYLNSLESKTIADFNYIWSILERKRLVEQDRGITGYGSGYSELPFYITDRGLKLYSYLLKD